MSNEYYTHAITYFMKSYFSVRHMYVCVCMCVCVYVYVCVCECVCVYTRSIC